MPTARPRAQRARPRSSTPTKTPASPPPTSSTSPIVPAPAPDPLSVVVEGLAYRLDGLPRRSGKKNIVTIRHAGDGDGAGLVDRVDLYAHRSRERLARLVADNFGRDVGTVLGHLALVLDTTERAAAHVGGAPTDEPLTDERRRAAEDLLGEPGLLEHAARALEGVGLVGETRPARLAFLVAVSRMLEKPLSMILLAPSGTGKSSVIDAVARLVPPEHVRSVERLTAAALFYVGSDSLAHRLLIVDEMDGQADADHPLRVLQSKGELRLNSTVGGKVETFVARGPVAVMSGTNSSEIDVQNASRCLLVPLDDSRTQTLAIQAAQRRAWAGLSGPEPDVRRWQDAQRVLAEQLPARVVIPFAERLVFPARTTTDRRGSARVLALVAAHAVLCSRRRRIDKSKIVAEPEDYRVVHALVRPLVDDDRDGLSPRATALLRTLPAGGSVTRDEAAKVMTWSYSTARRAIDELVGREALRPVEREYPRRWRVVEAVARALDQGGGLTDPDEIDR